MKKPTTTNKQQVQVRMDDALMARVRKYQEKLEKQDLKISFSSAARSLIEKGLDAVRL